MKRNIITAIAALALSTAAFAQTPEQMFKAAGSPVNPKVYCYLEQILRSCRDWVRSVKKSQQHIPILPNLNRSVNLMRVAISGVLTITDFKKGDPNRKPGMYIDGNIHSNEIQGAEFALYTAWYLTESFADTKFIQELLEDKVFYIVPTINPDGRDSYIHQPNSLPAHHVLV